MTSGLGTTEAIEPADVLAFWRTAGPDKWFEKDALFDAEIARRFSALWHASREGKLRAWGDTAESALALVIVLDQFPRNMFRGDARTYATDPLAREIASQAIAEGADQRVDQTLQQFLYMPFMHSEELADQERCVALFAAAGEGENAKFAEGHADIVRRFGRFPHRNRILGRATTQAEEAFLDEGGFSG
jgi:uncharacterized protein (DUF924 family)